MTLPVQDEKLDCIRSHYDVPARVGVRIRFQGKPGTIEGAQNSYLRIRLDGERHTVLCHPTWEMEYAVAEGRDCWYCGAPAVSVWFTTWDDPGNDWPMCGTCESNVRQALAHRAEGCDEEADAIDERSGISTDRSGGQWIDPLQSVRC